METLWNFIQSNKNNIWGQNSEWFWTMVQAIVVGLTLYFIYKQIKIQRASNMLATLNALTVRWESDSMRKARVEVCQQFLANNLNIDNDNTVRILLFFEELGLYYKKKVIDTDILWDMYDHRIQTCWDVLEPLISEYRAHLKDDTYYDKFEYMVNELQKYSEKQGLTVKPKTTIEKRKYAELTVKALTAQS